MTTVAVEPRVLSASTVIGDKVENYSGETLGEIKELMFDVESGRVAYAVLSFGGFLGMGDKLFALPWSVLELVPDEHKFRFDASKELLKNAPGFDKDNWPNVADRTWGARIHTYYKQTPYWEL